MGEKAEGEKESVEPEEKGKDAKTKVKEALDNIHMPKMPKLHKPAFLKKKKEGEAGGDAPAEGKEDEGEKENKEETKEEKEETKEEKKEEKLKETDEEKKPGFLDNLKSIGSHVQLPSFLSKKESKVKDVEAGGDKEEESKELLEKKEGEEDEKKEGEEETEKAEEKETVPAVKKDEGPSKATAFLDSLRNVASQVPSIFKGQKDKKAKSDKDADVEAGEKEELLEAVEGEIVEKKEGDLEEVKVVAPSDEDEKKDAEKPESSPCSIPKYLNQL